MSLRKINPTKTKAWKLLEAHFNEIKSSEIELIDSDQNDGAISRKEITKERQIEELATDENRVNTPVLSMPPPIINGMADSQQINRPVVCPDCSSRFEISVDLKMIKCPICNIRIDL